jgi:hypothetical protein
VGDAAWVRSLLEQQILSTESDKRLGLHNNVRYNDGLTQNVTIAYAVLSKGGAGVPIARRDNFRLSFDWDRFSDTATTHTQMMFPTVAYLCVMMAML